MRIIICGDRNWTDIEYIKRFVDSLPSDIVVITGGASGVDTIARRCADYRGLEVREFPAEWRRYGKAAGPIRNKRMLKEEPDLVVAFHWNLSHSKGTTNMLSLAKKAKVPVKVNPEVFAECV